MSRFVQKVRVAVRVSQLNRDTRDGWFMLAPKPDAASGPSTIIDLLNAPSVVIPFFPRNDPNVALLTVAHLEWVAVGGDVATHFVRPSGRRVTREQRVELRFIDQRHVEGIIQWDAREDSLRLSDFLNGPDDFFVLNASTGVLIVNRRRVVETRVAEASPRPAQIEVHDFEDLPAFKTQGPPA